MKLRDTLAVRSMASMILAMAIGASAYFGAHSLVTQMGRPRFSRAMLPFAAEEIVQILLAAPVADRARIATAASNPSFRADWYPTSPIPAPLLEPLLNTAPSRRARSTLATVGIDRPTITFHGDEAFAKLAALKSDRIQRPGALFLLVSLSAGDWVEFTVYKASWTVDRALIAGALTLLCAIVVVIIQSSLLAAPMQRFTHAIQRLGRDLDASPIQEEGPVELKAAIAAANAMQLKIRDYMDQRMLLFATISHDLRTPLTRMRLHSEKAGGPTRDALLRNVDEMSVMVENALALFNNEEDREAATVVDIGALVQMVADDFADQEIEVRVSREGGAVALATARPRALRRAVDNVVDNAVRYARDVEVLITSRSGFLDITVVDRGPGLAPDRIARLFQPFQRSHRVGDQAEGMGLGLLSAQHILTAHHGTVRAENRLSGGLAVTLSLPRNASPSAKRRASGPEPAPPR